MLATGLTGYGQAAEPPPPARDVSGITTTPPQSVLIDIRGPIAHVTVTRTFSCTSPRGRVLAGRPSTFAADAATDVVLDLALPERSELLDVTLSEGGRQFRRLTTPGAGRSQPAYLDSLQAMGLAALKVPFEDEARYRMRAGCHPEQPRKIITLRYQFSMLVEMTAAGPRLAFPAAAELSPPPARVEVRVFLPGGVAEISIAGAAHPIRSGDAARALATVSTRSPWIVAVLPFRVATPAGADGQPSRLLALTAIAAPAAAPPWIAYSVGAAPGVRQTLPERVLFVVDRSRSVGPGGLEGERDVARKILETLPAATRFNALFFDRTQARLFPVARAATREAIAALDQEMVPARSANGTDIGGALRAAGELLRRDAADFSPRCLLAILTDGAVGAPPGAARLPDALGQLPNVHLMVAAIAVRPNDDPPVSPDERRVLRGVAAAAPLGGVERSIRTADIPDAVPALLESLRGGGDIYGIALGHLGNGGGLGKRALEIAEVLESGAGASGVLALAAATGSSTRHSVPRALIHEGLSHPIPLRTVTVKGQWLGPGASPPTATPATARPQVRPENRTQDRSEGRFLASAGMAALFESVVRPSAPAPVADSMPRGYMERSVVRDSLSLAFTPRARACYLNRTAKTAADRDLTGRVRLALDLVRGEVGGVRVQASSLSHPAIENCLREAAYAIEVPRAYRNDDAVTAVLNLVFRPRTPERERRPARAIENQSLSREIDLMIEAALEETSDGGLDPPDAGLSDSATRHLPPSP